jgi:hypothetical protein
MEMTLEEFFEEFRHGYLAGAEVNENFQLTEFMESVTENIRENGDLEGYEFCHYDTGRGTRVDGYWFDDEDGLSLFVADFAARDTIESLTQTEVTNAFKRASNFFQAAVEKNLYTELEITAPEYGLARQIADRADNIKRINLFLVSERRLSDRVQGFEQRDLCGRPVVHHIWDLTRLHRQRLSKGLREPLEIDFCELFGKGVPCLKANLGSDTLQSYLVVMPGRFLADLYERYGARLLEQNVRAFLQNRGSVNRGIRATILGEPGMFFAYNNGITATASNIHVEETPQGLAIVKLLDLQIVNGGQTTASLFHTRRSDKASLSEVFVQMKLSVVSSEEGERIVPKIAEYANTQNKVNAADLFSNSPFHIRMEEISRRLYAPVVGSAIRGTKWFYERTRGQYRDELVKRTPSEQKRFAAEYPKEQVFTKTDLAKYENVWEDHPRHVNFGAQKNFARFAERIAREWEEDDSCFNEFYFRRAVARALIFRATEKLVSAQPWYDGGYRANIVAYGIALIQELAKRSGKVLDTRGIWSTQAVPSELLDALRVTTCFASGELRNPAQGISNVTEWAKREKCWERMKGRVDTLADQLPDGFAHMLIPAADERRERSEARKDQVLLAGVAAITRAMQVSTRTWRQIRDRLQDQRALSDKEASILAYMTQEPKRMPSDKQAAILMQLLSKGENEGIKVEIESR